MLLEECYLELRLAFLHYCSFDTLTFVILDWLIDYFYFTLGKLHQAFTRNTSKHHLSYVKEGLPPVVVIQGIAGKWGFMRRLVDKISLEGYPIYTVPDLGNNMIPVESGAKIVRSLIEGFDLKDVVLIGHSKGGLISKYLLAHLNGDNRIKGAITIATPFGGTKLAHVNPHSSYKELRRDSELIKSLNDKTEVNDKMVCVIPSFDNHVWPQSSCFLPGAKNIQVKVKGHHKVVFDNEVQDLVLELLKN